MITDDKFEELNRKALYIGEEVASFIVKRVHEEFEHEHDSIKYAMYSSVTANSLALFIVSTITDDEGIDMYINKCFDLTKSYVKALSEDV